MSEYDFEGEESRVHAALAKDRPVTNEALRRAYAAGQSNGATVTVFGTPSDAWGDLDRLVALAAAIETGRTIPIQPSAIAVLAADLLKALKAQAVKT